MSPIAQPTEQDNTAVLAALNTIPVSPLGNTVIVYSKPSCVQCNATYRALTEKGIDHEVVDLTEHPAAVDALRDANFLQAPVVRFGDDVWAGFRPDKIAEVRAQLG